MTVKAIKHQLVVACLEVQDTVTALQTETGVKDKIPQFWIDHLILKAWELQTTHIRNRETCNIHLKNWNLKGEAWKVVKQEICEAIQRELYTWLLKQPECYWNALPSDSHTPSQLTNLFYFYLMLFHFHSIARGLTSQWPLQCTPRIAQFGCPSRYSCRNSAYLLTWSRQVHLACDNVNMGQEEGWSIYYTSPVIIYWWSLSRFNTSQLHAAIQELPDWKALQIASTGQCISSLW